MNCLITQTGKQVDCFGAPHDVVTKQHFRCKLSTFLKRGGCRVKLYQRHGAVECGQRLTTKQLRKVNRILRDGCLYSLVTHIAGKLKTNYRVMRIRK